MRIRYDVVRVASSRDPCEASASRWLPSGNGDVVVDCSSKGTGGEAQRHVYVECQPVLTVPTESKAAENIRGIRKLAENGLVVIYGAKTCFRKHEA